VGISYHDKGVERLGRILVASVSLVGGSQVSAWSKNHEVDNLVLFHGKSRRHRMTVKQIT
jgi:hypothetical protein